MSFTIGVAGGQGLIGQGVCKALIEGGRVERIIVLDLKITGRIEGVEERIVDVHKKAALVEQLKDIDLVVNIVAPYYKHGTVVADAALEAGIHYVDACADIDITKALLAKDEMCKNKGITLITGLGASPGITNLLVKKLAARFDEALEAHVVWVTGGQEFENKDLGQDDTGLGTLQDFIQEEFGEIPTYIDGKYVTVTGFLDGAENIKFGDFIVPVYHSGHSEPITIPQFIPSIHTVSCKGNCVPFGSTQLVRKAREIGLNSEKRIKVGDYKISPIQFLNAYLYNRIAYQNCDLESLKFMGGIQVKVVGVRDGKKETEVEIILADRNTDSTRSTAIPIAVVSEAIVHGEVKHRGAYAPEALDAQLVEKFIEEILRRR